MKNVYNITFKYFTYSVVLFAIKKDDRLRAFVVQSCLPYSLTFVLFPLLCVRFSFNPDDGLLYPSKVRFHPKSLSRVGELLLRVCARLRLIGCSTVGPFVPPQQDPPTDSAGAGDRVQEEIVEVTNFTLINLVLRICGPMTEANTTRKLLGLQVCIKLC